MDWPNLAMSLVGIAISVWVAIKFGDMAAHRATVKHQERKDAQARVTTLAALLNEVRRAREYAKHNVDVSSILHGQNVAPLRMPVTSFETAFVKADSANFGDIPDSLLQAVCSYLTHAGHINSYIDCSLSCLSNIGNGTTSQGYVSALGRIKIESQGLPAVLDELEAALAEEHSQAVEQLSGVR